MASSFVLFSSNTVLAVASIASSGALRGNTSMASIFLAAINPTFLPLSAKGLITFVFKLRPGAMCCEDFAKEHHGTLVHPATRLATTTKDGCIAIATVTDSSQNEVELAESLASWVAIEPGEARATSSSLNRPIVLSGALRIRMWMDGAIVYISTIILVCALNAVQTTVSGYFNGYDSTLHLVFKTTLWINSTLILAQWSSVFSYSNAYRGLLAPWMFSTSEDLLPSGPYRRLTQRDLDLGALYLTHQTDRPMVKSIRRFAIYMLVYPAATILGAPGIARLARIPRSEKWSWVSPGSVLQSFAMTRVTLRSADGSPKYDYQTVTHSFDNYRTRMIEIDGTTVKLLKRQWHGVSSYRLALSPLALVTLGIAAFAILSVSADWKYKTPIDPGLSRYWIMAHSILWPLLTVATNIMVRVGPRLNGGLRDTVDEAIPMANSTDHQSPPTAAVEDASV